ncbi:MAG TPA: hypothetical protein VFQ15_10095, partial [Jiangellaceae bacterium]|nr:hypothetical protein [Jiangellaceae bacterium]
MGLRISRKLVLGVGGVVAVVAIAGAVAYVRHDDPDPRLVEVADADRTAQSGAGTTLPPPAVPEDKASPTSATTEPPADAPADSSSPPPPGGFPNPASTGVPAGWTPAETRSTDLEIRTPGTVVEDVRFTDSASILVYADDVTIRRVEMLGGFITNQYGDAPGGCGHDMLVENVTFKQQPGQFSAGDYPVIGEGSYTARAIEVVGRGEGPRLSDCGPVTLENSFISIHG